MKQKYVCCNSLKNLLTAILFFIALVFTSNAFAVECTDSVDNDNDGLIDANDLGCQGECGTTYYCGDSTTDRSMTDGNEKGREVPFTTVYNVTNDGEVTLEMKNDDVVFVLKRVEDGKTYVIGICNEWVDEVGSDLAPLPVNQSTALGAVGSGGRNEAAVYDRNGNLQIHFPVDGSHTCPQAARSDTSAGRTTVAQRSVKVKKGDKIYINTRHEKDPGAREHNGISFRKTCTKNPCLETQAYTSTETDNGKDYKNKGTTTYTKGLKSISVTDYCVSDTVLAEYYKTTTPKFGSDKKPTEGNGLVTYTCAYRCSKGACIPQCTKDSDCQSGYKCSNEVCVKKSECEDGVDNDGDGLTDSKDPGCQNCSGSACKENQSYTSSDTDGGDNPNEKGTATYKKGSGTAKTATDTCESDKVLVEYYNTTNPKFGSNGKPVSGRGMKKHTCDFTCAEGACQPQCKVDPDCPSNEKCVEGRCVAKGECEDGVDNDGDGLTDSKDPGCQNCSGSACKENQSYTSSDTDGGDNPNEKGTATYKKGSGTAKTATDTCESDKVLVEYYNTTNPKFGSNGKPVSGRGMKKHTCDFTCAEGACQPQCKVDPDCPSNEKCVEGRCVAKGECEDGVDNDGDGLTDSKDPGCQNCSGSACKENQSYTSSDTDGGDNPNEKGTATYKKGSGTAKTATDTCESDKVLVEYYNTTNPKFGSNGKPVSGRGMKKHTCDFTCAEGACQPQCKVDPDCPSNEKCVEGRCVAKGECEDGVDNDGDGLTDSKDPGCQNCSGSACKENQSYTSSDTDGGDNPNEKGTATYKKGSGSAKTATDTCESDKVLVEYYNTTNPKFGSNGKPVSGRGMTKHTCEFTCKEGACQPQCKVDSDCPSGQKCENNTCIDDVKAVQPLAECVYDNGDGTFVAYFGYENNNAEVVTTKACDDNTGTRNNNVVVIKGSDYIKWECSSQPTTLETGRVKGAFYVQFRREESVTWSLETNSEGTKEATLDAKSVRCAELAPVVSCIDINNDGTLQAYFGYKNMNDFELHIPVGSNNKVIPSPEDRGQPENFFGGNNNNAFDEKFESNANLKWELDGITVIADKTMNTCRPNSAPTCQDDGQTLSVECQGDITTMQVNASSCKDPESNKLSYSWSTDCKGASITHQNEVIATLSLTEPGLGKDQTCKVSVTVTDGIKETTMTQNVKVSACVIAECFDAKGNPGSYDQCGVCNGDDSTCVDCHGVPNGKGVIDLCGVCDGNNACVDCAGIPYGTSVLDRCNTCNGDGTSCLECSDPTDVKGLKAGLHGDEFVTMLDEQTEELLDEENPYPLIRDIEASAERRVNRAEKKNDQIKALLAGLPDKMETCNNDKFCSQNDNEPTLNTIKRYLRKLRRQVGRTVRQRNISEKERQSLLNTNAKLLAGKLDTLNKIPRFYSICK